jgi:methionyl-tRNA formyltransferase
MLKICKALPVNAHGEAGRVIDADATGDGYFTVACGEGALKVLAVIPEGKGRMSAGDLLRGRKLAVGDILE